MVYGNNDGNWSTATGRKRNRWNRSQNSWGTGGTGGGACGNNQGGKTPGGKGQGGKGQGGKGQGGKGQGSKGQGGKGTGQDCKGHGGYGSGNGSANGSASGGNGGGGKPAGGKTGNYQNLAIPRGTKIECHNGDCERVDEYADTAGWACPKCGSDYFWGEIWETLKQMAQGTTSMDEDNSDQEDKSDSGGGAKAAGGAAQEPDKPPTEATVSTKVAAKAAKEALEKADTKLERERVDFVNMGEKLQRLLGLVDDQTAKMATKRLVCMQAVNDHTAATQIRDARDAEHKAAGQGQLDGTAGLLDATTDRTAQARRLIKAQFETKAAEVDKLQAETDRADKAAEKADKERAAKIQAAKVAASKAAEDIAKLEQEAADKSKVAKLAREALQSATAKGSNDGGAPAVATVVEVPAPYDNQEPSGGKSFADLAAADEVDMDSSDDEVDVREMDPATWAVEVSNWAFYAKADDVPNPDLLGWFVSWEDDKDTTKQLEDLLTAARDKFLAARQGAAADGQVVSQVALTGDTRSAHDMQKACDIYNVRKYHDIHAQLVAHLSTGTQALFEQRQKDLDAGNRKAPKAWRFKAVHATRTAGKARTGAKGGVRRDDKKDKADKKRNTEAMASKTKAAKEAGIASLGEEGLTPVPGGTATAAAAGS